MLTMRNDYAARLGLNGEPLNDEQVSALCADIDARRVGLDVVTSPDGRHHAHVSTVFMVEHRAFSEMKGGPYETLVRRLDSPDGQPGAELVSARYWTAAEALAGHREFVESLGHPRVIRALSHAQYADGRPLHAGHRDAVGSPGRPLDE
jgi:hypothetical protein